jgi:hypothetical protein
MIDVSPLVGLSLAYIDPGSGSLLVQVIIGSLLAVPFFLRGQIARVVGALRRRAGGFDVERFDVPRSRDP